MTVPGRPTGSNGGRRAKRFLSPSQKYETSSRSCARRSHRSRRPSARGSIATRSACRSRRIRARALSRTAGRHCGRRRRSVAVEDAEGRLSHAPWESSRLALSAHMCCRRSNDSQRHSGCRKVVREQVAQSRQIHPCDLGHVLVAESVELAVDAENLRPQLWSFTRDRDGFACAPAAG